jgi:hypothetical protein
MYKKIRLVAPVRAHVADGPMGTSIPVVPDRGSFTYSRFQIRRISGCNSKCNPELVVPMDLKDKYK